MRPDLLYLQDILVAADAVSRFLKGVERQDFTSDELRQSAVLQKLTVMGEAAARLSSEFRDAYPEIEWKLIVGLRNVVVHAYFSVDWASIWQTAIDDLPGLVQKLGPILTELQED